MVTLTIDNQKIEVPEGTTVLRAAQQAGIHIPTLCDHPALTPYGGCRLCLVEVDNSRTLQTACTLPVVENMVVRTVSPEISQSRQFVLSLIFSERNHFCPYCQVSSGDCELQNAAYHEGMTHWPLQPNWKVFEMDASHPYIILEQNRCILCRRCVRACGELVGNFTLGVEERGANNMIVADLNVPLGESTCVSCGMCVQVCPTGTLIDRRSAYLGKEVKVDHHLTVCVGCSVGCGVDVQTLDNNMVRISGNWDAPVNAGVICKVGRFQPFDEDRERVRTPLVRKDGALKAATWEDALGVIASHFKPLMGKNGDGLAALASTRLAAETLYLFREIFKDGLGCDMVTTIEEGYPTAAPAALADELNSSFEGKLANLKEADCVLALDTDLIRGHEVAGFFVKRALPNGVGLIVVDAEEENDLYPLANWSFKIKAGTQTQLLKGIQAALVKLGLVVDQSIAQPDAAVQEAAQATAVDSELILEAAYRLGSAEKPVFVYGKDASLDELKALLALAKSSGASVISTKGKANSLAAAQYRLDSPFEIKNQQAAFVALGDAEPSQKLVKRLEKAPFLAVQASYISPLTAVADVVLPVAMWAEQEGHYLNLEGRLQKAVQALQPPEGVRSNLDALQAIAEKVGVKVNVKGWQKALSERTPATTLIEN